MLVLGLLLAGLVVAALVFSYELSKLMRHGRRWQRMARAWSALQGEGEATTPTVVVVADEPVPVAVPPRTERWCRRARIGRAADRCQLRRRMTPLRSEIITKPPASPQPASSIYPVSRPGELVRPDAYRQAPPLPPQKVSPTEESQPTYQPMFPTLGSLTSVEIDLEDLEDLVDTQPSVALTAAEADALLQDGEDEDSRPTWDQRDTQPQPTMELSDIMQEAPTGPGLLVREDALAG